MRFLLLTGLVLTSCVTSHLEFMAPELRQAGLQGKTIAVGPVISANPDSDPSSSETAALQIEAERQLQQLRPKVRMLTAMELERLVGAMNIRHLPSLTATQLPVVTPQQWKRMAAHPIHYLLLTEMVENRVVQKYDTKTETQTHTETDADGKERECTTEKTTIMADSRRYSTLRLSLTDTSTRQVVWQARAHGQN
ncbi:MAG: hypothetical protein NTV80_01870, partial [Verrucomicrobia bacterium]|nr:hypothetical protein [Verrucomicrobiota bacterium]